MSREDGLPPAGMRDLLYTAAPALGLALAAAAMCRAAVGVSLGLFFGGVAVVTLLVPTLSAGERSPGRGASVATSASVGVALVWLTALGDLLRPGQWLACCLVLFAYALALAGGCHALIAARWNPTVAAGLVTGVGLLWLTWPVWLTAPLLRPGGDALAAWLVPAHPLFAVNGVLSHFDAWDRYPLAYRRLTVLSQDVFYAMPATVLWATVAHATFAAATFAAALLMEARRHRGTRATLAAGA